MNRNLKIFYDIGDIVYLEAADVQYPVIIVGVEKATPEDWTLYRAYELNSDGAKIGEVFSIINLDVVKMYSVKKLEQSVDKLKVI